MEEIIMTYPLEIPFDERPKGFQAITIWGSYDELEFAIKQLKQSSKPYSIEKRDNQIRVYSNTMVGTLR